MVLHPSQFKLLEFLKDVDSLDDYSLWDIARETGLKNAQNVSHHLKQLEKLGYLRRALHDPNQFELLKDPVEDIVYVNQYGFAQCGHNSEFFEDNNLIEKIGLSTKMFGVSDPKNLFLVKAKGNSMEPYIQENDLVLFKKQEDISASGDVALVLDDERPKIKRVIKREGGYSLISINPSIRPKEIKEEDNFSVIGVARGVIHSL